MRLLIYVVCAVALVSSSPASAAPSIGDDGRSSTTKPPGEMLVAQAWWDAAYNAATAQRQTPASAGNLHAAFDEAGAGNVARSRWCDTRRRKGETTGNTNFDLNRRASPRPY